MKKKIFALVVVALLVFFVGLPLSNIIFKPAANISLAEAIPDDPEFREIAGIFESKCQSCHIPESDMPFYAVLPVAKQLLEYDVSRGLAWWDTTRDLIPAEGRPVSEVTLAKVEHVVNNGSMPPHRFLLMHWDAFLTGNDKVAIRSWVERVRLDSYAPEGYTDAVRAQALHPLPKELNLDPAMVALGERMFNDKRLSTDNTLSCASCHDLAKGGTDQAAVSTGVNDQLGPINSPTVYNSGHQFMHFWDGRAATLEEQAEGPVENSLEMASTWDEVMGKLNQDDQLKADFATLFPDGLTGPNVRRAIADFERSLDTPGRYDLFLQGDTNALTPEEQEGWQLFLDHGCATCHVGKILGGQSFERMGRNVEYYTDPAAVTEADWGRFNHTKDERDRFYLKVPTLRNIALTWPYFHDAVTSDLAEAVRLMDEHQTVDKLSEADVEKVVGFLNALTGEYKGALLQ